MLSCSVGIDESDAKNLDGFICELCSFEEPEGIFILWVILRVEDDEEEYVFEKEVSTKRKRNRSEFSRSAIGGKCVMDKTLIIYWQSVFIILY